MAMSKPVKAWAFYDFSNSSYVLIFMSFLFPIYFSKVLHVDGYTLGNWGIVNGVATILGTILAVIAGAYADKNIRLNVLKSFIKASFIGMTLLSLSVGLLPNIVSYLFIVTHTFFVATLALSDSILPFLSKDKKETFKNSGFAWGLGYVGGIVCLIPVLMLQRFFGEYSMYAFLSVAIFYLFFSILAMRGLKGIDLNELPEVHQERLLPITPWEEKLILVGFWLFHECITVIILFYSIYASTEIGLSSSAIGATLLFVQLIGFPATWLGGCLPKTNKDNLMFLLGITVIMWVAILLLLVFTRSIYSLAVIVFLTGLVIGNSQSYLRSIYSIAIEKSHAGQKFGIYAFVSQAAVVVAPVIFGYSSDFLGSQKFPLIVLGIMLIIGYLFIFYVYKKANARVASGVA